MTFPMTFLFEISWIVTMLRHIDVLWSETCMEMMVVRQKKDGDRDSGRRLY